MEPDDVAEAVRSLEPLTQLIAGYYHQLRLKGIPEEAALDLTKDYQWHMFDTANEEAD